MRSSGSGRHEILFAIAHAAAILAPSHLSGISREVLAADVMMRPDFGAAQAREERLGLIGASRAVRIAFFVVDPAREIRSVQAIP